VTAGVPLFPGLDAEREAVLAGWHRAGGVRREGAGRVVGAVEVEPEGTVRPGRGGGEEAAAAVRLLAVRLVAEDHEELLVVPLAECHESVLRLAHPEAEVPRGRRRVHRAGHVRHREGGSRRRRFEARAHPPGRVDGEVVEAPELPQRGRLPVADPQREPLATADHEEAEAAARQHGGRSVRVARERDPVDSPFFAAHLDAGSRGELDLPVGDLEGTDERRRPGEHQLVGRAPAEAARLFVEPVEPGQREPAVGGAKAHEPLAPPVADLTEPLRIGPLGGRGRGGEGEGAEEQGEHEGKEAERQGHLALLYPAGRAAPSLRPIRLRIQAGSHHSTGSTGRPARRNEKWR